MTKLGIGPVIRHACTSNNAVAAESLDVVTSGLLCAGAAHKPDPPIRIDYVWTDGSPTAVQLINRNVTRGLSFSDHLGVEVRTAHSLYYLNCLTHVALACPDKPFRRFSLSERREYARSITDILVS